MKFSAITKLQEDRFYTPMYDSKVRVALPRALGGDNVGTSPLKILCSAVASCVALMVYNQLDDDESEGVQVDVSAEKAKVKRGETTYLTNWEIWIDLVVEIDEGIIESVKRGLKECPAEQLLLNAGEHPTVYLNGKAI